MVVSMLCICSIGSKLNVDFSDATGQIIYGSRGSFEFNLISCFPSTYKNRPNGARIDIAQAFANVKLGYVRLPDGNDLESPTILEPVYAGYSLNGKAVPQDQLQPYINEVIKELDFLTASSENNRMGALRKRLGRRQPFEIRYIDICNED
ncbi:hypothetical protein I4U23_020286 [Adineta vaga]|nr:hypothetical protein I4U23_020286 [Adineta vaga]